MNKYSQNSRSNALNKWLGFLLRLVFGFILLYAAIDKIIHPVQFAQAVENYQLVGERLSRWIAVWLPYLELGTAMLLIAGIWLDAAALINLTLMTVFLVAVSQAYWRGLDINCGCFSTENGTRVSVSKVVENALLFSGSIVLSYLIIYQHRDLNRIGNTSTGVKREN